MNFLSNLFAMSAPPPLGEAGPSGTQPPPGDVIFCIKCGNKKVSWHPGCWKSGCPLFKPLPDEDQSEESHRRQLEQLAQQTAQINELTARLDAAQTTAPIRPPDDEDTPVDLMAAGNSAQAKGQFYQMFIGGQAIANEERVSGFNPSKDRANIDLEQEDRAREESQETS
jgi:predicted  nucleic acid-binding Zn-ribbon protein